MWMNNERAIISVNGKAIATVPSAFIKKHERITRRRIFWNLVWAIYGLAFLDWALWYHRDWRVFQIWLAACAVISFVAAMLDWRNPMKVTANRALLELHQHMVNEKRNRERKKEANS